GKPFFLLIISTLVWSALLTMSQIGASIAFEMVYIAELLRYFTWFYILQYVMGSYLDKPYKLDFTSPLSPLSITLLFILAIISLGFNQQLIQLLGFHYNNALQIIWMLIFTILGLILVEQLYRNTSLENRWKISFLCISAGAVFIYDFFVFSNAFLVQKIDYEFWSARGIINVMIAPTLLIASARNPSLSPNIHISRQFVFHSTTLLGSGIYLILMSMAGYYIKVVSGEWGDILQYTFLFAAFLLFSSLFFSSTLKARIKRYVSRNFTNKYDYREEWNRFSSTLLEGDEKLTIHLRSLQAVSQIVDSQGARLWLKDVNQYNYCSDWHMPWESPVVEPTDSPFIQFIYRNKELFSREEYLKSLKEHSSKEHWFLKNLNSWLILPLWVDDELFGYIHLKESFSPIKLDHEDRELLTTITHHVTLYLSQYETTLALQQAEKFKSMNQMTAFLTHDLKTLLSQLFLLVENGKIHKDNPAFIDDMLNTLEHVSQKMQRLVQQLKEPIKNTSSSNFKLLNVLNDILDEYRHNPIKPELINTGLVNPEISANKSEIQSALKHIIQNATESINRQGFVKIELDSTQINEVRIRIIDNGNGMSTDFIANRLFRPFDSTKGVSGMGIGVYQSREYIRSIGGEIQVSSKLDSGTTFTITLPTKNN
ncbi:MAG: PEP-CTERM system histidine kinase PrsK, partial [Gammaproteobacteria bacterium]|nr:PEP-CTERM system histidine kinase PrsK [Gammaproteobacteria bacterium]